MRTSVLLVLLVCIAGCSSDPEPGPTPVTIERSLSAPDDYQQVSDSLFYKPFESTAAGGKFELVEDSGVEFSNEFDRDKPYRFIETGAGLAIADYDGDGLDDIYPGRDRRAEQAFPEQGRFPVRRRNRAGRCRWIG